MGQTLCFLPNKHTARDSLLQERSFQMGNSSAGSKLDNSLENEVPVIYLDSCLSLSNQSSLIRLDNFPDELCGTPPVNSGTPRQSRLQRDSMANFMDAVMLRGQESTWGISSLILPTMWNEVSSTPSFQMWKDVASPTYIPVPMTKVLSNLYIGTYDDAIDEENLERKGITHILSLVGHQSRVNWVKHKQYVMNDFGKTIIKDVLNEVYEFMKDGQKGNNKLLVHCQSGQNRSAVVIISFLMMNLKKTLFRAHRQLKKLRPIVQVNVRYAKQLLELEKELFGESSLPQEWMDRQFDEAAEELIYKYEDLSTKRHATIFSQKKE